MNKKKIFFFSYPFPPYKAIGAIRIHAFARSLTDLGCDVNIYSTSNTKISPSQHFDLSGMNVKYKRTFDYKTIQFLLQSKKNSKKKTVKNVNSQWVSYLTSFPINLFVGMGGAIYILNVFISTLFSVNNSSILFSSYSPYADHIIAYFHKLIRPKVFWICDFRDLHITPGDENLIKFLKLNKWFNRRIIAKADIVTTVSKGLSKELKKYNANVFILRNGIHPEMEKKVAEFKKQSQKQKFFSITYTGGLYGGRRDPSILLNCLSKLINKKKISKEKIKIIYVGNDGFVWDQFVAKYGLEDISDNRGAVSLEKSLQYQCESTLNLLITWATLEQQGILTGKFYEYLIADRPIINIINGVQDQEFESLFNALNPGIVIYNSDEHLLKLQQFLYAKYNEWQENGYVNNDINQLILDRYYWSSLTMEMINRIEERKEKV